MKAAVIFRTGDVPKYVDIPNPEIENDDKIMISVTAAAIKHFDRITANRKPTGLNNGKNSSIVIGSDGVGVLADGTRVYAFGGSGMMAERAAVSKYRMITLPDEIDDVTAAAIPNAAAGSALALISRAAMLPGENVLINGATGFTGKIAVQAARHYGAGKIIVTGRNEQSLQSFIALGADEIIPIKHDNEVFIGKIKKLHSKYPIDIVIDYLWGMTAESILAALSGKGSYTHKTRYISVGSVSGDKILLSSETLRSVDLTISGSGLGTMTNLEMSKLFNDIIPEMFKLAAEGRLLVDIEQASLKDIEKIWNMETDGGKRFVVTM